MWITVAASATQNDDSQSQAHVVLLLAHIPTHALIPGVKVLSHCTATVDVKALSDLNMRCSSATTSEEVLVQQAQHQCVLHWAHSLMVDFCSLKGALICIFLTVTLKH